MQAPRSGSPWPKKRRDGRSARGLSLALAAMLGAGAVVIVPLVPRADTGAASKPAGTLADAKVHMDKGQELFLAKKFAEAAAEFHTAYEIKPYSTFLFNEAVCHEKLGDLDEAIRLFQKYLDVDPTAPDRASVGERIERLKKQKEAAAQPADAGDGGATDEEAGADGAPVEAGPAVPVVVPPAGASVDEMKSIVVIESLPDGAPVEIWTREAGAGAFVMGGENKGWKRIVSASTPLSQSLPLGTYHVVIPKFQDYRATETDVTVAAATISQFKANLAQGAFFGVLKIRSFGDDGNEVRGAHVFVKRPTDKGFLDRGVTPYEESFENGTYLVRVEQPGFAPLERKLELQHGQLDEEKFELQRSDLGLVRVDVTGADEAEVIVDDVVAGKFVPGSPVDAPAAAGSHRIKVKSEDRKTLTIDVEVPKGKMVMVHADLKPTVPRGSAWTTGVAAVVFLGGGIYLGVVSSGLKTDLSNAKTEGRLDQNDSRIKKGQYFAIGADICFAVGAVFTLISTYNFLKDPLPNSSARSDAPKDLDALPAAPKPTARIVPMAGPSFAGLSIIGEF